VADTISRPMLGQYLLQKAKQGKVHGQMAPLTCPLLDELLAHGLDIDSPDQNNMNWTAFHYACDRGELEKVQVLVSRHCNTRVVDTQGRTGWSLAKYWASEAAEGKLWEEVPQLPLFAATPWIRPVTLCHFTCRPLAGCQ
jgi:hypothetical protein